MELPVLIEKRPDGPGYRARLGEPFNLTAEAATIEEAERRLTDAVRQRLATGAELHALSLPTGPVRNPVGGWLPEDELTREWRQSIEAYRAECDAADRRRLAQEGDEDKAAS